MTPFFSNPERLSQLVIVAQSWVGTPFRPFGTFKGRGCACHTLCQEIYRECGFLPADFTSPRLSMRNYRATGVSPIRTFMDTIPEMQTVTDDLRAGDMVLFLTPDMEHSGLVLPDGGLIHSMIKMGVTIGSWKDAPFVNAIAAAWRPMEI